MKNSSRLVDQIAQNFRRSSSGARVLGELQHAVVEVQPRQLAVEEQRLVDEVVGSRRPCSVGGDVGHARDATPVDALVTARQGQLEAARLRAGRRVPTSQRRARAARPPRRARTCPPGSSRTRSGSSRAAGDLGRGRRAEHARAPRSTASGVEPAPTRRRSDVGAAADGDARSTGAGPRAPANAAAAWRAHASSSPRPAGRERRQRRRASPEPTPNEPTRSRRPPASRPRSRSSRRRRRRRRRPARAARASVRVAPSKASRASSSPSSTSTVDARAARGPRRTARRRWRAPRIAAVATTRMRSAPAARAAAALARRRRPPRPRSSRRDRAVAASSARPMRVNARSTCTSRRRPSRDSATSTRVVFDPMSMQAQRMDARGVAMMGAMTGRRDRGRRPAQGLRRARGRARDRLHACAAARSSACSGPTARARRRPSRSSRATASARGGERRACWASIPAARPRAARAVGSCCSRCGIYRHLTVREAVGALGDAVPGAARRRRDDRADRARAVGRQARRGRCPAASSGGWTSRSRWSATRS